MNNSILLDKAMSKVTDENLKAELAQSKERGQLTFKIEENKIVLIKVISKSEVKDEDIRGKSYYTLASLKTNQLSQNVTDSESNSLSGIVFSKTNLLITSMTAAVSPSTSVSTTAQTEDLKKEDDLLFIVMVSIGFKSGVLEHEKTDYNEKKSILNLEERPLIESTHIILTQVVL